MSIIPITSRRGRGSSDADNPFPIDVWDSFLSLRNDLMSSLGSWDPFPFHFPDPFSISPFSPVKNRVDWRETGDSHVFRAYFPGLASDDVVIEAGADRVLKISGGDVSSSFRLPDNVRPDLTTADMEGGFLVVNVPKAVPEDGWGSGRGNNVRVVEITDGN